MPSVNGVTASHRRALSVDFLDVQELSINSTPIETTTLIVAPSDVADLNGEKLVIDADADTYIRQTGGPSGTDDSIDVFVAGALDFQITANTLIAKASSVITTDTISETTSAAGVTVDGVLLKDGGAVFADAATIEVDTINEATAAAGVTLDSVLLKDGVAYSRTPFLAVTADGAITVPLFNRTHFITKAGVAALTIVDPTATTHDGVTLTFIATTAQAHTLSNAAGSGFFSSGGGTKDIATFGGAIGDGITIIAYQGKWYIDPRGVTNVTLG